jgi:hypothetical protein
MSNFNGRKVDYATLHETIHTPATGELKRSLSSKASGVDKPVQMRYIDGFLEVVAKGTTVLIPVTGVKNLVLAPEVKEEAKV